jgi:RNA recognition motif-containing protein
LSKNVEQKDLEKRFNSFGRCRIDKRIGFAFIEFDDEFNAEDAKEELSGANLGGLQINIEWSKRSGRFNPREAKKSSGRSRSPRVRAGRGESQESNGGGYRSRRPVRSPERRDRRKDRMDPDYHHRESWSYSYSMSPKAPARKEKKNDRDEVSRSKNGKPKDFKFDREGKNGANGKSRSRSRSKSLEQGEVWGGANGVVGNGNGNLEEGEQMRAEK